MSFTGGRTGRLVFAMAVPLAAQVNVLTWQYDNTRAGANLNEIILTPANVNVARFGKLFSQPVDGQVYAQPLYVADVNIAGKGSHNTVFVATEHDSVYAFDADNASDANASPLWHVSFLNESEGVTTVPASDVGCGQVDPELGVTGTPVIDVATGTLYVVAMTKEQAGGAPQYVQRLHALDIRSGAEKPGSPVVVQATYPGTGEGGSTLVFAPKNYKQRPGLLLLNGVVYTAWSSHCDIGRYHGWLIGYDAQTLQQVSVYNNTPDGNQGSFWGGNAGPAVDNAGNIYLVAGNGAFDAQNGGRDLGESYIKLSAPGGLAVKDYFAPFNFANLNSRDLDIGSAGVALLSDEAGSQAHPHLMVGAGKEGRIYLLDRDDLGKWRSGSDSQIVQSIPGAIGPLFGNPAYFNRTVYFCGSGDNLKAFAISNASMIATPASQSATSFPSPGCVPSISASGSLNGIVWALDRGGLLRAYDAPNLAHELYNSNQNPTRDSLGATVKFTAPMIANGKVYAGTQSALAVYGLLAGSTAPLTVTNAAGGQQGFVAPGSIISIYGSGLASDTESAAGYPLPKTLGNAAVTVNALSAPLYYVRAAQINAQIPFETPAGTATVTVSINGVPVGSADVTVQSTAPGLFLLAGPTAAVLNQDGSVNSATQPASAGSVIAAYVTGLGGVSNPVPTGASAPATPLSSTTGSVSASFGGQNAFVQFAGLAPGFAGLYQVNVEVPALPPGQYALQIAIGNVASNTAPVAIR